MKQCRRFQIILVFSKHLSRYDGVEVTIQNFSVLESQSERNLGFTFHGNIENFKVRMLGVYNFRLTQPLLHLFWRVLVRGLSRL